MTRPHLVDDAGGGAEVLLRGRDQLLHRLQRVEQQHGHDVGRHPPGKKAGSAKTGKKDRENRENRGSFDGTPLTE